MPAPLAAALPACLPPQPLLNVSNRPGPSPAGQKKEMVYLAQTTKKGTQYVEGALSNQWGANVIVLR